MVEPTTEYGYRDLGILQECRRRHLDSQFARQINDLALAMRLYHLRREHATNAAINGTLDRVFTNIIRGDLNSAHLQLTRFETDRTSRPKALEFTSR